MVGFWEHSALLLATGHWPGLCAPSASPASGYVCAQSLLPVLSSVETSWFGLQEQPSPEPSGGLTEAWALAHLLRELSQSAVGSHVAATLLQAALAFTAGPDKCAAHRFVTVCLGDSGCSQRLRVLVGLLLES